MEKGAQERRGDWLTIGSAGVDFMRDHCSIVKQSTFVTP